MTDRSKKTGLAAELQEARRSPFANMTIPGGEDSEINRTVDVLAKNHRALGEGIRAPAEPNQTSPDDISSLLRSGHGPRKRIDGRTLRRSGRTVHFATKVSPDFDDDVRRIAQERGWLLCEVLEKALELLQKELQNSPK